MSLQRTIPLRTKRSTLETK